MGWKSFSRIFSSVVLAIALCSCSQSNVSVPGSLSGTSGSSSTGTPLPIVSPNPSPTPLNTPAPQATPSPIPKATPTPVVGPSPTPSPVASPSPTPSPNPTPSPSPSPTPTPTPTPQPTAVACPTNKGVFGVNLSGNEYSWESLGTSKELSYLKSKGVTLLRVPTAWEKLQGTLNGPLNAPQVTDLKNFLTLASTYGIGVVVDIHNYAMYNTLWAAQVTAGQLVTQPCVGSGCVTLGSGFQASALVQFWTLLAQTLKGQSGLIGYDLMNEPNSLSSNTVWSQAAQAIVNGIRTVDTTTTIVVEGYQWAGSQNWVTNNPGFPLRDPSNKIVYEAHSYWDDTSSTYPQPYSYYCPTACPQRGVQMLQHFVQWIQSNHLKGFVGEFGVPANDSNWITVLSNALGYLSQNGIAGTYWSYGYDEPGGTNPWWVTTMQGGGNKIFLDLEPDGSTPPQWATLNPYLASGVPNTCFNK